MRTAGLLIALSALIAVSVHADPDQVTQAPAKTDAPIDTKAPVTQTPDVTKEPVTQDPIITKEPVTKEPETKEPETKEPETKDPATKDPATKDPVTAPPLPTPTPEPTKPTNGTDCHVLENKDRLGFDIGSAKGKWDSCDAACEKNAMCQTWTWNDYNGGTCWLKSYASKLVDKTGVWATDCTVDRPSLVCNAYKDIDFVGMDIGSRPGKSFGDCCDICSEFNGCTAYAWTDFNGGTCWLKKSVGHVVAKVGVWSSSTVQLWGPVCPFEYDVDFVGNDIGNKPAKDAGVCCSQCKENKNCKAYSWNNHNGGTCWMKSGKGESKVAMGVISAALAGF